jgi:hypothetical protein
LSDYEEGVRPILRTLRCKCRGVRFVLYIAGYAVTLELNRCSWWAVGGLVAPEWKAVRHGGV